MTAPNPEQALHGDVRRLEAGTVVDLRGDIDGRAEHALGEAYARAEATGAELVVLNFSEVGYINSTGIALIVGLLARSRATGRRLSVVGLSEHYREIFTITRLSDFMSLFADEASALASSS